MLRLQLPGKIVQDRSHEPGHTTVCTVIAKQGAETVGTGVVSGFGALHKRPTILRSYVDFPWATWGDELVAQPADP